VIAAAHQAWTEAFANVVRIRRQAFSISCDEALNLPKNQRAAQLEGIGTRRA
jgi:hypothetical protein